MVWNVLLGILAGLSAVLGLWQWVAALRFPLHRKLPVQRPLPGVTVLKPLKGCDEFTDKCLRSWFCQEFPGPFQLLLGVASDSDPVGDVVRRLLDEFPTVDASLFVCAETLGANAKVSTLGQLHRQAKHDFIVISDADVFASPDLLANAISLFTEEKIGVVSCFYRLANPSTVAMRWEAVAVNADFWSQVLQSNTIKPMEFALGAVMIVRRQALEAMGGFEALANCLADDFQLGQRTVRQGWRAELCPTVVECWDPPQDWSAVWRHQLRWARTIRACQPIPYFFSILNNGTLWPVLWAVCLPSAISICAAGALLVLRTGIALHLMCRLTPGPLRAGTFAFVVLRDLMGIGLWIAAFLGNTVEWRGHKMRLARDGTLLART